MAKRRYIYWYPFLLVLAWSAAWLGNLALRSVWRWGVAVDTIYWTGMKVLLWLIPVFLLIVLVERKTLVNFLGLNRFWRGTASGILAGLAISATDYVLVAHAGGKHLGMPDMGPAFWNAVLVAPITEEIVFRGFFLTRLQLNGISFWNSNLMTTAFFLAMHLVGWSFQGRIGSLASVFLPAAPLLLLSLLLGWMKQRMASLYSPIAMHILNNFYSFALKSA